MPDQYKSSTYSIIAEARRPRLSGNKVYRQSLFILLLTTASAVFAQVAEPDCQCRAPGGQMQDLGTVACFDIVGNNRMLRCEMSTNTPYWKELEGVEGCPDA